MTTIDFKNYQALFNKIKLYIITHEIKELIEFRVNLDGGLYWVQLKRIEGHIYGKLSDGQSFWNKNNIIDLGRIR